MATARLRRILLVLCWVPAAGFVMHALVQDVQRVLILAGALHLRYPFFTTVNRHVTAVVHSSPDACAPFHSRTCGQGEGRTAPEPSKLVLPAPGSHDIQDYATRSEKARVTAAVRLETCSRS